MSEHREHYGTALATVDQLQAEIAPVVARAAALVIVTPQDYADAAESLKRNKGLQAQADEIFVAPWRRAKADAEANRKKWDDLLLLPLRRAETILKEKQREWSREQERQRAAEQARLQAEENERARRERERMEREAAKLKTPELREARLAAAAEITPAVVTVASAVPKVKGQSVRKIWRADVTNKSAAIEAVMDWPDWEAYVELDMAQLDRFAQRTKGAVKVPGVEFYEETVLASAAK